MWVIIFMAVGLKIPVVYLLWVTWWAVKSVDEPVTDQGNGGCPDTGWRRGHPRRPGPPRRGGPHGLPLPSPPRVRVSADSVAREPAGRH